MNDSIKFMILSIFLSLAAMLCLPLQAEQITIKSCNVLYEGLYQKWAKGVVRMPTNDRRNLLIKAFDDSAQFAGSDILCFQEWDVNDFELRDILDNHGYGYRSVQCDKATRPDGLVIAWKKDKFLNTESSQFYVVNNINRAIGAKLFSIATGKAIYIVSLHATFFLGYEKRYESVLEQLKFIKDHINTLSVNAAFICGDFNYNTHSKEAVDFPNRELLPEEVKQWYPKLIADGWSDPKVLMTDAPWPTLFGYTGFENVDYLLNKGNVTPLAYWQYPQNPQSLIKHNSPLQGEGPDYADYFSDHAIISALFDIK